MKADPGGRRLHGNSRRLAGGLEDPVVRARHAGVVRAGRHGDWLLNATKGGAKPTFSVDWVRC